MTYVIITEVVSKKHKNTKTNLQILKLTNAYLNTNIATIKSLLHFSACQFMCKSTECKHGKHLMITNSPSAVNWSKFLVMMSYEDEQKYCQAGNQSVSTFKFDLRFFLLFCCFTSSCYSHWGFWCFLLWCHFQKFV